MKIRNIFSIMALASSLLFTSCEKEDNTVGSFDNIKLDKTFLSFPANGGTLDLKVTATEDWKFVVDENWPKVITFNDGKKATHDVWGNLTNDAADIKSSKDSWVQADVTEGKAGEVTVKFTAEAFKGGREQAVAIVCGGHKQQLILRQGDLDPVQLTCKEIKETAAVGASYSTRGVVTKLGNYASYGAFYINDGTYAEDVQVYGSTKDSMKDYPNVEVGDSVYFSGTWSSYKNFENVTITKLKKSLAKVISASREDVSMEGETLEVVVAFKGKGVNPVVPAAYQSWISVLGITSKNGTPTKLETNPADTAYVTVRVEANAGGDRSGVINFTSSTADASSEVSYSFTQKGAIIDATVSEFLAAAEGDTQYRVTGVITKISASSKYHNADITVSSGDFSSSVLLYRVVTKEGNIEDLGLAEGDVITVVGKRSSYSGTPQMAAGGVYESHIRYNKATLAEFLAAPAGNDIYAVTGEITAVANLSAQYNNVNITIKDESNTLYLYRVTTFDKSGIETLNPTVGGMITVAGKRGEYNGSAQMAAGGVVLAYSAPTGGGDEPQPETSTITLTVEGLPTAYPKEETTVTMGGIENYILNVANYGDGIQMKKEGSYIANKSALKKITKIKVTVADDKKYYPDNVSLYVGNSAKPEGSAVTGTSDDVSTTFDLSSGNCTFFTIKNASRYAVFFSKIEITCEK